jgi:hypothetical protein
VKGNNPRVPFQQGMNGSAEMANAFPVNDADAQNPALAASLEVIWNNVFDVSRAKRVQVENAVNGQLNRIRFVHSHNRLLSPRPLATPG